MTLHPALQRTAIHSSIARVMAYRALGKAANDNGLFGTGSTLQETELFDPALRYFGKHGLGAARGARKEAEAAFFANDSAAYDYWLGICRVLDRRLALQASDTMVRKETATVT